jgi:hypothetical protein
MARDLRSIGQLDLEIQTITNHHEPHESEHTMFYGTINSNGTIDTSKAFSNNFTVSVSSGQYTVSFNEFLHYPPTVTATALGSNTSKNNFVAIQSAMTRSTANYAFQASFWVWKAEQANGQTGHGFTFHARSGQTLMFDAGVNTTLALTPSVQSFTYTDASGNQKTNSVLVLSTGLNGLDSSTGQMTGSGSYAATFDKGTVLLGIREGGGTMTLEIPNTMRAGSNTWNLTGWTYGGGAGTTGTQWTVGENNSTYTLQLASPGGGAPVPPMTTPESFVIMATCDGQILTSDPVIRLSNVPPAGVSL